MHPCIPVHVFDADFKLVKAVPTKAVVAGAVVLFPAVCVDTVVADPVKSCIPVHVFDADFKLLTAVLTKAVDAAYVELSDDVFVKTDKSKLVVAGDSNVKVVSLPI